MSAKSAPAALHSPHLPPVCGVASYAACGGRGGAAAKRLPSDPQSVIVCLFPYLRAAYPDDPRTARVARFARNRDYHAAILPELERAAAALRAAHPGYAFAPFVDNSPVWEVRAAALAGLGVVGDHGLLLHPLFGSWVHIGCIVTDLALSPTGGATGSAEPPGCRHCGECARACPTGCLGGGKAKATYCLAAITQKKGALTPEEEALIRAAGSVWGCDRCQEACPLNAAPAVAPHPCLQPLTPGDEPVWAWRGDAYIRNCALFPPEKAGRRRPRAAAKPAAQSLTAVYDMDTDGAWESAVSRAGQRLRGGIGTLGERTLHAALKQWYAPDEATHEQRVGGHIADAYDGARVLEVQTAGLHPLREKLAALLPDYAVTVVYPLAARRRTVWLDPATGEAASGPLRRHARLPQALAELFWLAAHAGNPHLTVELVLLDVEEHRLRDGWSRDGKRGSHRVERLPLSRPQRLILREPGDYAALLPPELPPRFSADAFGRCAGLRGRAAWQALRLLEELHLLRREKEGRRTLYILNTDGGVL